MIPPHVILTASDEQLALPEINSSLHDLRARNKGWNVNLFSDADQVRFVQLNYDADVFEAYSSINPRYGAARADLFRYLAIYKLGGVYLDIKSTCMMSFDEIFLSADGLVLAQWDNKDGGRYPGWGLFPELWDVSGGEYVNWFFAARAGHPLIRYAIIYVLNMIKHYEPSEQLLGRKGILRVTGPVAWTRGIVLGMRSYSGNASFLPRIENCNDLALLYSVFDMKGDSSGGLKHRTLLSNHYTKYDEPVVLRASAVKKEDWPEDSAC